MITPSTLRLLAIAAVLAVAFGAGWSVNGWRLTSAYNAEATARAEAYTAQVEALTKDRDALAVKLKVRDDTNLATLKKAQNETNRLRDCLLTGTCGLRIKTACPVASSPGTASGPGVDTGTGSELDPTARSAYFALRDGIDRASSQLAACQDQLRLRAFPPADLP